MMVLIFPQYKQQLDNTWYIAQIRSPPKPDFIHIDNLVKQ